MLVLVLVLEEFLSTCTCTLCTCDITDKNALRMLRERETTGAVGQECLLPVVDDYSMQLCSGVNPRGTAAVVVVKVMQND